MKLKIQDIKIHKRIRKSAGNIEGLKISLSQTGLIHPILIDEKNNLVSGYRRLMAAKELGWDTIEANVISGKNKKELLTIEAEENFNRLNFTAEEYSDYAKSLKEMDHHRCFLMRFLYFIYNAIRDFFLRDIK